MLIIYEYAIVLDLVVSVVRIFSSIHTYIDIAKNKMCLINCNAQIY